MIVITGATEQLGRAVVKQLAKRVAAERIGVFVRDERKAAGLKEQGVKLFVGNYDDIAALDQAMRGVEKVLLISGTEQNRIQQHQNVVDAAQRAGVQLIAYTSRSVKGQDTTSNPLMEGHFATEAYIERSGLNYAVLRNALYMDVIPLYLGGAQVFEKDGEFITAETGYYRGCCQPGAHIGGSHAGVQAFGDLHQQLVSSLMP